MTDDSYKPLTIEEIRDWAERGVSGVAVSMAQMLLKAYEATGRDAGENPDGALALEIARREVFGDE